MLGSLSVSCCSSWSTLRPRFESRRLAHRRRALRSPGRLQGDSGEAVRANAKRVRLRRGAPSSCLRRHSPSADGDVSKRSEDLQGVRPPTSWRRAPLRDDVVDGPREEHGRGPAVHHQVPPAAITPPFPLPRFPCHSQPCAGQGDRRLLTAQAAARTGRGAAAAPDPRSDDGFEFC